MRYLALDQALQVTGWAVFEDEELIAHGSFSISPKKDMGERLVSIYDELSVLHEDYDFETVFFEDIQNQRSTLTYCRLAYVQAAILMWCSKEGMESHIMPPSHWRKIIGGNFGMRREEQKDYAKSMVATLYNISVESDEADAILIGRAGYLEYLKE